MGFSQKYHAKRLIQNNFIIDKDYKILILFKEEQDFITNDDEIIPHPKKELIKSHGGNNKEIIMMNRFYFKTFCLKSYTKKTDEIHDYFIKLEETLIKIEAFIFKNKVIYNYNGRNYKYKCRYCKFD